MIENNLCESCKNNFICRYKLYVEKFSNEAKKPMGIDIEILQCSSYEKDE